jgi:AcrR family transcriptional regulator
VAWLASRGWHLVAWVHAENTATHGWPGSPREQPDESPGPPRDHVTEQSVREAALTLFAQRGYHGTALRDIANEVGIRTPSLYNHIESKQELLRGILLTTTEQVWSDFETAVEGVSAVGERLRRAVVTYAMRHAIHRREALIVNRDVESLDEPARSDVMALRRRHECAVREIIIEGVGAGVFRVKDRSWLHSAFSRCASA